VGEGGDEVSVARFIADQRTNYQVPHALVCALLGVSEAWFYKWIGRADGPGAASGLFTDTDRRRDTVDRAVAVAFRKAKGLHGSPRLHEDLREVGWRVSEKTVAESMRRQGLVARVIKRRSGLTRQDRSAPKFPDLVRRTSPRRPRTASGSATSPRSPRPRASCTWPPSSTCTPAGCSARPRATTPTPS
jgi:hypothetical protein